MMNKADISCHHEDLIEASKGFPPRKRVCGKYRETAYNPCLIRGTNHDDLCWKTQIHVADDGLHFDADRRKRDRGREVRRQLAHQDELRSARRDAGLQLA